LSKIIQENFGEAIIAAVIDFAKRDLSTVDQLTANEFAHVSDQGLRTTLAETFYGARWIYKLGLALLVRDVEQMAHVRTQVMDFGAVCEGGFCRIRCCMLCARIAFVDKNIFIPILQILLGR
jgi:hypothetical protein